MNLRQRFLALLFLPYAFSALVFLAACSGRKSLAARTGESNIKGSANLSEDESIKDQDYNFTASAWPALALLRAGKNPLWFELGQDGPRLIESPAAAALAPFTPWPHASYITGILPWDDALVMAMNRLGFLVFEAYSPAELMLYYVADGLWKPYTTESFFIWDNKPAVLLYRNDFFSDKLAPPPGFQVYVLDRSSPIPVGTSIKALEIPGGFWEAEVLRQGFDGFWYYRMKQKGQVRNETAYFKTEDLSAEGEKISVEAWRNSNPPEASRLPVTLKIALNQALDHSTESPAPLLEFYQETPDPVALVILPDGRGICSFGTEIRSFSLSTLPEGFVYTGVALLGRVIVASWEEQLDAGIGAAGFMVLALD